MKDTEQNKALAEWLGWTEIRVILGDLKGVPPADWKGDTDSAGQAWVPDFGRDLNVTHKIAMSLSNTTLEYSNYCSFLNQIVAAANCQKGSRQIQAMDATAPQRRKALLCTLNLWKP